MTFERFDLGIGVSDSRIVGYVRTDDAVVVSLRLWNETLVELRFGRLVLLHDCLASDVDDIVRGGLSKPALEAQDENGAGDLVEYRFVDAMGRASLLIVCEVAGRVEIVEDAL